MPGTAISTMWPGSSVKSSGGTSPVPVSRTLPRRHGVVAEQPFGELVERAAHPRGRRLAGEELAARPRRGCACGSRAAPPSRRARAPPGRARTRRRRSSPAGGRAGSSPSIVARRDVVADRQPGDRAALAEHEADLGLGDVPAGVGADADRLARPDRAPAAGVLQEELGSVGVVDEAVDVLDRALLDPGVAAALVRDAGAPDLGRLDRREQRRTGGQLERLGSSVGRATSTHALASRRGQRHRSTQ